MLGTLIIVVVMSAAVFDVRCEDFMQEAGGFQLDMEEDGDSLRYGQNSQTTILMRCTLDMPPDCVEVDETGTRLSYTRPTINLDIDTDFVLDPFFKYRPRFKLSQKTKKLLKKKEEHAKKQIVDQCSNKKTLSSSKDCSKYFKKLMAKKPILGAFAKGFARYGAERVVEKIINS